MSKKTPLNFGRELAKIQLTKVSKYSFGGFVSSVCQYLFLYEGGVFFDGILDFLHKNMNYEENPIFRRLPASI